MKTRFLISTTLVGIFSLMLIVILAAFDSFIVLGKFALNFDFSTNTHNVSRAFGSVSRVAVTLLSMLASVLVAVALATRITRPLEELTTGAQALADGDFDRRLSIRSNDEIQILADSFNHMTRRLKQNVEQLEESIAL